MAFLGAIVPGARGTARVNALRARIAMLVLVLFCPGLAVSPLIGAPPIPREYQIKAVFLYNFVQFVEWPDSAFPNAESPIMIGVLGDDPFGPALDEAVRGERVRDRPLVIKRAQLLEDLAGCQLVFVARQDSRRAVAQLGRLGESPVLTVGETDDFTRHGGGIAFYPEGKKIRFEINVGEVRRRGLKVSAELLALGKTVGEAPASEAN